MRQLYYLLLMVALPTGLFAFSNEFSELKKAIGVWGNYYDHYTRTEIRVKDHRRGIKVRINGKRWRTFNYMGRGVYDDCAGRAIVDLGRGDIKYVRGGRKIILSRAYGGRYNDYGYRDSGYRDGYSYLRDRYSNYGVDRYCGTWGCSDPSITLRIEAYGDGFRARNNRDTWVYYDRYSDGSFRDRRGNRYYFDDRDLIWQSARGARSIRFRRR